MTHMTTAIPITADQQRIAALEREVAELTSRTSDASEHRDCGYPWVEHICPDNFDSVLEKLQRLRENPIPPPPKCDHLDRPDGKPLCRPCWDAYRPKFEAWSAIQKRRGPQLTAEQRDPLTMERSYRERVESLTAERDELRGMIEASDASGLFVRLDAQYLRIAELEHALAAAHKAIREHEECFGELHGPSAVLRERLAALCHDQWSGWMRYQFSDCDRSNCPAMHDPTESPKPLIEHSQFRNRWYRQMRAPYADLTEEEKESDRKEADRILAAIAEVCGPVTEAL